MKSMTLRHTSSGWHVGITDETDRDFDNVDRPYAGEDLGALIKSEGVESVDIREDVPADDVEAVIEACGRRLRSVGRYTTPATTTTKEG